MRNSRPVLVASALVLALAAPAAGQVSAPVGTQGSPAGTAVSEPAGSWELTINTPQDTSVVNLNLQQEGDKLTGNLSGRMGTVPVTGTSTAGAVALEAKIDFQGNSLLLGVDGKVAGDTLDGTFRFGDFGEFPFTGKRAAAAPAVPSAAAAPPATPAAAASASAGATTGSAGNWNVVLNIPGVGEFPATALLTQDSAGIVGGALTSAVGQVAVTGTMAGTTLTLEFKATTPQGDIPIVMTGELTDTGLSGKASIVGLGEAGWTATRVQ